ncbi:MAG: hypothetical protein EBU66_17535, partial [Bacteroidetes bacterium]|nr:hypothetical protein [Bacteroidota bacterium]
MLLLKLFLFASYFISAIVIALFVPISQFPDASYHFFVHDNSKSIYYLLFSLLGFKISDFYSPSLTPLILDSNLDLLEKIFIIIAKFIVSVAIPMSCYIAYRKISSLKPISFFFDSNSNIWNPAILCGLMMPQYLYLTQSLTTEITYYLISPFLFVFNPVFGFFISFFCYNLFDRSFAVLLAYFLLRSISIFYIFLLRSNVIPRFRFQNLSTTTNLRLPLLILISILVFLIFSSYYSFFLSLSSPFVGSKLSQFYSSSNDFISSVRDKYP